MYVAWLQQEYPECLPDDIVIPDTSTIAENINTNVKSQNETWTELKNLLENSVFKNLVMLHLWMSKPPQNLYY